MTDQKIFSDFSRSGKRLFTEHLVDGNFGNMSARYADGYFVTRTGSYLDVDPAQTILMPLNGRATPGASSEWRVHTAIYNTAEQHSAVVHAHPIHAIVLSFLVDNEILTIDSEGKMLAPSIVVVNGASGTQELANSVAKELHSANVVIARGHGTFAAGKNLDQAYLFTSLAEHCCKILYYTRYHQ
jgi:L-fuculose-phosphate aldolase